MFLEDKEYITLEELKNGNLTEQDRAELYDREINYRIAMTVAKEMLSNGIISDKDFSKIKDFFIEKYNPFMAKLEHKKI